jgi:predicted nucleic acid-binding protein
MKPRFLLDSAILIDVLKGVTPGVRWLQGLRQGEAVISVITRAELLAGGPEGEQEAALSLCDLFECLDITQETADLAARLRRARRWKLPDAFQAALAQRHGLRLVTRNTKDFDPAVDAFVSVPYECTNA